MSLGIIFRLLIVAGIFLTGNTLGYYLGFDMGESAGRTEGRAAMASVCQSNDLARKLAEVQRDNANTQMAMASVRNDNQWNSLRAEKAEQALQDYKHEIEEAAQHADTPAAEPVSGNTPVPVGTKMLCHPVGSGRSATATDVRRMRLNLYRHSGPDTATEPGSPGSRGSGD